MGNFISDSTEKEQIKIRIEQSGEREKGGEGELKGSAFLECVMV